MYHDSPDKEDSLPCLIQKMTPVPQQHRKVSLTFSQGLHPVTIEHIIYILNDGPTWST